MIFMFSMFRSMYSSTTHLGQKEHPISIPSSETAEEKKEDDQPQDEDREKANKVYDAINNNAKGRSFSRKEPESSAKPDPILTATSSYIGETEDNEWWEEVPPEDPLEYRLEGKYDENERKEENEDIYKKLRSGISTFRYQNA